MSDWSGPTPIPQQYPGKPTDGIGQFVGMVKDQATRMREITSNLLRSMGVRARPGQMSSLDYDGTSHAALGTLGWALASDNGGPSYLALNGVDVYADLAAKAAALATAQATLATQQATLTAQQASLTAQQASLTSQLASINSLIGQQNYIITTTGSSNNFAVGTTESAFGSASVTTPAGFTNVSIQAIGGASMYYTGATNPETLFSRVVIGASGGTSFSYLVDTSTVGARITASAASHTTTLSGLATGQVITAYLGLKSNASTWPANTYNTVSVSVLAIFSR